MAKSPKSVYKPAPLPPKAPEAGPVSKSPMAPKSVHKPKSGK